MKRKDKGKGKHKNKNKGATLAEQADKHALYQKSVQAPEAEAEFFEKAYTELRGKKPVLMREDFCGTAYLATTWCESEPERRAIGVDICPDTLAWGREHNVEAAGEEVANRIQLVEADVRNADLPLADVTCALNFSYCIFKSREELRNYFESARKGLKPDGLFIVDLFGGTECQDELEEDSDIDDEPATYIWEHAEFNPINNNILCHIHYEFDDGSRMDKAFTYDWRLWSIQEVRELMQEAGFSKVHVYWERFEDTDDDDDELEGTGEYYRTEEVENQESWMTYIVAEV